MNGMTSKMKTLAIFSFMLISLAVSASAQSLEDANRMARAMDSVRAGDWSSALRTAEVVGPVARDIIEWHRLRAGQGDFDATVQFLQRRSDWPGLQLLRRRSERSVPVGARANEVISFFQSQPPQSGPGAVSYIAALRKDGQTERAESEAESAWLTQILSTADEAQLLRWYGTALEEHHIERLDMLLWRNAEKAARRMFPRVDREHRKLGEARLALRARKKGVDGLVDAVPKALQDDPGLLFERMQWRARKGLTASAIELMRAQSPEGLGRAESWAGWRRSFARTEMRAGRADTAYDLASRHGLSSGSHYADLEWLSGYLALTYQKDGEKALGHFLRFRGAVETPISLGRAGYWEGRAHELIGDEESARLAYLFGAEYQTSFYGLLAAEAAGKPMDPRFALPIPTVDLGNTGFAGNSVLSAANLLLEAGERDLGERFLTHLTESLGEQDVAQLGAYMIEKGQPHISVMIGKRAASKGLVVPFVYYPLADLGVSPMPVPEELALAIARRESEFDHRVTSGAGARGLMQVMPKTAKAVAGYLEIPFSRDRLLTDANYNARLGTAYLDELMEIFDGNIVMVSAGYNAGPGRPIRWMKSLGDPRRGSIDIVDWIEHIPFDETRNYVMRVAESLPIYRARLTGQLSEIDFSSELIAMPGHVRKARKGNIQRPKPRPEPLID